MLTVLELDVADLAATRFAISPLGETLRAVVEALLGTPRARLLGALRSPATTSALARRLGVTPSAVSQHPTVLHRGELVDRQRSGRTVLYQASALGLALLGRAAPGGLAVATASS
jgi:DNA-binding transcriptional ArsR family regulator